MITVNRKNLNCFLTLVNTKTSESLNVRYDGINLTLSRQICGTITQKAFPANGDCAEFAFGVDYEQFQKVIYSGSEADVEISYVDDLVVDRYHFNTFEPTEFVVEPYVTSHELFFKTEELRAFIRADKEIKYFKEDLRTHIRYAFIRFKKGAEIFSTNGKQAVRVSLGHRGVDYVYADVTIEKDTLRHVEKSFRKAKSLRFVADKYTSHGAVFSDMEGLCVSCLGRLFNEYEKGAYFPFPALDEIEQKTKYWVRVGLHDLSETLEKIAKVETDESRTVLNFNQDFFLVTHDGDMVRIEKEFTGVNVLCPNEVQARVSAKNFKIIRPFKDLTVDVGFTDFEHCIVVKGDGWINYIMPMRN